MITQEGHNNISKYIGEIDVYLQEKECNWAFATYHTQKLMQNVSKLKRNLKNKTEK